MSDKIEPQVIPQVPTHPQISAHIHGFEQACPETQEALLEMVRVAYDAMSDGTLQRPKRRSKTRYRKGKITR